MPAPRASCADLEQPLRLGVHRAHGERVGAVCDGAVERDSHVDRDHVALLHAVPAGDAVDDDGVRRDADRRRIALVAHRRRDAAVRGDERSAMSSSSPVVMPGRICSPTCAIVSATSAPARAIRSISSGRLADDHDSLRARAAPAQPRSPRTPRRPCRSALQRHERARSPVALDHGRGLLVVDREPACDRLRRVVGPASRRASRPSSRSVARSSETSKKKTRRAAARSSASISSSASACAEVAREAVEHEPLRASGCASRSRISAIVCRRGRDRRREDRLDLAPELRSGRRSPRGTCRPSRCGGRRVGGDTLRLGALAGALRAENRRFIVCAPEGEAASPYLRKPS